MDLSKIRQKKYVDKAATLKKNFLEHKIEVLNYNEDGSKTTAQLDFTKNDLFTSPYYYLKQNDVVVVDPNYAKVQRSASNPNTGIFFSLASLLLSVIVIISR